MSRIVTMATLRTRSLQLADKENDGSIGTTELQVWISLVYGELHGVVAESAGRYYETEATISLTTLVLPADCLATLGVAFVLDSAGHRRDLTEAMLGERNRLLGCTGEAHFYAIRAQTIELYPAPTTGTYKLLYVPQPADLSGVGDSEPIDLVTADGEAMLLWGVVKLILTKGKEDVRLAMAEKEAARVRLKDWCIERTFASNNHNPFDDGEGDGYP